MAVCASCASDSVTEISMTLADGQHVEFVSCHRCEHKTWSTSGREIELDRVLELAAATRRR